MPIDPKHATFINLDRGKQIVIEKDTDYQWRLEEGKHPITGLKLEAGGLCIYYHLEDGVWYCSEYEGDFNAIPQLKIKFEASESEVRAREAARVEWESRKGTNMKSSATGGSMEFPTGSAPRFPIGPDEGTASHRTDHGMNMPEPVATAMELGYSPGFPKEPTQPHESACNLIDKQQGAWQQSSPDLVHFPSAALGAEARRTEKYPGGAYEPTQQGNIPPLLPSFPTASATSPPSFPYPSPLSHQVPMPNLASMPPIHDPGQQMVVNDSDFLHVGAQVSGTSSRNAISMPGSDRTVDWDPDLHQELHGA